MLSVHELAEHFFGCELFMFFHLEQSRVFPHPLTMIANAFLLKKSQVPAPYSISQLALRKIQKWQWSQE